MLFTILSASSQLLIPLVAIIFSMSIPIVAIVLYYKHKAKVMDERKLMIKKGLTPPELSKQLADARKKNPMNQGIDMLGVALGIVTGYLVSSSWGTSTPISIICAILFFLGIANIVKSFLFKNETDSYE